MHVHDLHELSRGTLDAMLDELSLDHPLHGATCIELDRRDAESTTPVCWPDIVAAEPRLLMLEREAETATRDDWRAWSAIVRRLRSLAGWDAERTELRTSEVYDVCYRRLLDTWEGAR